MWLSAARFIVRIEVLRLLILLAVNASGGNCGKGVVGAGVGCWESYIDLGVVGRESTDFLDLCFTDGGFGNIARSMSSLPELARERDLDGPLAEGTGGVAACCMFCAEGCEWSARNLRSEAVDFDDCNFGLATGVGVREDVSGT